MFAVYFSSFDRLFHLFMSSPQSATLRLTLAPGCKKQQTNSAIRFCIELVSRRYSANSSKTRVSYFFLDFPPFILSSSLQRHMTRSDVVPFNSIAIYFLSTRVLEEKLSPLWRLPANNPCRSHSFSQSRSRQLFFAEIICQIKREVITQFALPLPHLHLACRN